jgi:protein involved in polysaccharide export with SLBB domain
MKFFLIVFFLVFCTAEYAYSQVLTNISNVKVSELKDAEIQSLRTEMDKQNISIEALEKIALTKGMSSTDFLVLKSRLENLKSNKVTDVVPISNPVITTDISIPKVESKKESIYGSEIFSSSSLSFEPNSNMATPGSYMLGPGDELQIVIYGMQEYAGTSIVSKEGKINIPVVGQVTVNGLTFDAAQIQIKKACSKIYTSLNSGQSHISISLSKIRTIRVTIIGAEKSGNYSVSSLSTVFNALHIAGGPDDNGSYRKIELIRNNKIIKTVDIYRFLTRGDQSDNINLQENDVVRIPVYDNRVKVEGNSKRQGIFEMLPGETFENLLEYCGGFDDLAYRKNVKLIQQSGYGLKIIDLTEDKYKTYNPQMGDVFKISPLSAKLDNKVSIKGAVYRPDDYEFVEGMTVSALLQKADGLTQDAYTARAVLIREKEDLTKEITDVNIAAILNGDKDVVLRKNDELVISSAFDFKNQHTVKISGEVKNEGEYPYLENITLYDLILLAGGFTDKASKKAEVTSVIIRDEKAGGDTKVSDIRELDIDTLLIDKSKNIVLKPYDVIQIRKKPVFGLQRSVLIRGQVEYPGVYVIADRKERILDVINRSGGFKYGADLNSIRVVRKAIQYGGDGNVDSLKEVIIPVDYDKIVKSPSSKKNFTLQTGDIIVVGEQRETVIVSGNVQLNTEIPFARKNVKYYISGAGGYLENADKKRVYVIHPNGMGKSTRSFLGIRKHPKVLPGSDIIVPTKPDKSEGRLSTTERISIAGVTISLLGTLVAIIRVIQ